MTNLCDMHIHTKYSDGSFSGVEIVELAKERGMKTLSITDHDSVDFYFDEKALKLLKKYKIEYLVGCEFICLCNKVPIEILGYGIDKQKAKEYLDLHGVTQSKMNYFRADQTPKMLEKFGIHLKFDKSQMDFSIGNISAVETILNELVTIKEAKELLESENVNLTKSRNDFMREGLNNPNSKFHLDYESIYPPAEFIIKLIKSLGGVASLAHPYQYREHMMMVLESLAPNLDGVECYHYTSIGKEDVLLNFCKERNLLISGGSDFHRFNKNNLVELGESGISRENFEKLKNKIIERNSKN